MNDIERVTVLGAGTMGHGIAQVAAAGGYEVMLHDPSAGQLAAGIARIRGNLDRGVERGKVTVASREQTLEKLSAAPILDDAVRRADLVIEAAPERMEIKLEIFERVDALAPPDAILATNTSSLSVTRIASATGRAGSVVGLHFFNPVHVMRLLEVVRGAGTSESTLQAALAFATRIGKEAIVVTDTPGFASSRLGVALGLEAMRMLEEGVATPEDIDRAMELGYNHPMGPLRLTDLVGLDVRLGIAEYLHQSLGDDRFAPPEVLRRMVAEGRIGRKVGRGFYEWEDA